MDALKNFAYGVVLLGPAPPATGLSLTLQAGQGADFPVPPFNATCWPQSQKPRSSNAEIVRVTAMVGDTVTSMLRQQEGSRLQNILAGFAFEQGITAKLLNDIAGGGGGGGGMVVFDAAVGIAPDDVTADPVTPATQSGQNAINEATNECWFVTKALAWQRYIQP